MKYVIEIEETLVKHIVIEAENSNEALAIANDAYNNEEVVLDYRDYMDTEFKYLREADEDDVNDYWTIQN
jgi:hypothetical protein